MCSQTVTKRIKDAEKAAELSAATAEQSAQSEKVAIDAVVKAKEAMTVAEQGMEAVQVRLATVEAESAARLSQLDTLRAEHSKLQADHKQSVIRVEVESANAVESQAQLTSHQAEYLKLSSEFDVAREEMTKLRDQMRVNMDQAANVKAAIEVYRNQKAELLRLNTNLKAKEADLEARAKKTTQEHREQIEHEQALRINADKRAEDTSAECARLTAQLLEATKELDAVRMAKAAIAAEVAPSPMKAKTSLSKLSQCTLHHCFQRCLCSNDRSFTCFCCVPGSVNAEANHAAVVSLPMPIVRLESDVIPIPGTPDAPVEEEQLAVAPLALAVVESNGHKHVAEVAAEEIAIAPEPVTVVDSPAMDSSAKKQSLACSSEARFRENSC